ncbi:protein TIFY 10a [Elaeis guineensis]|uniref:Protein TIFY n=1 Tax=Elaeis guineensis var. tenera TaxID=51953 RepID=A0A6I9RU07_ELAGV|nr:protein TIFY 10a [Elaeis guineensis]
MADKSGKREEKQGGKSSFSVTCSRLSQYLKENGSFGGISLSITPRPLEQAKGIILAPTTMSLMPGVAMSAEDHSQNGSDQNPPKSMDLFPQHAGFDSPVAPAKKESSVASHNNKEPEKNQLTIFYSGKVLVFDNFPAEKVEDLMQMAGKESLVPENLGFITPSTTTAATVDLSHQHRSNIASTSDSQPLMLQNSIPKPTQANASDMPIARRNSLHRFLEKRKDRITTKAPYQVNASSSVAAEAAKPEDSKSWLNLGRPVSKPEQSSNLEGKR